MKCPELLISEAFIDGQWVKTETTFDVIGKFHLHGPTSTKAQWEVIKATYLKLEPSSEAILGQVSNADLSDFKKAISSAAIAQEDFARSTTAAQRGAQLHKWYDLIIANQEDSTYIIDKHWIFRISLYQV